jgi:hypothetical protein
VKGWRGWFTRGEPGEPGGADDPHEDVTAVLERYAARRYAAQPVRPWMLVASRVGLWGAVVVGALGGMAGCLGGTGGDAEPVAASDGPDPAVVPAQVAGVAEDVVEEWLLAERGDEGRLAGLFVESPELPTRLGGREVRQVRTVAGQLVQPGYWSVTVVADLARPVEPAEPAEDPVEGSPDPEPEPFTWYVEVGIVGDPRSGLAALRTPAIMPGPPAVAEGWSSNAQRWESPDEDDELARTVEGFLDALLAGEGDPQRYLAPGVEMAAVDPPPLEAVVLDELAVDELDDGRLRVQARVTGLTAGEEEQPLAYELVIRWGERYEVLQLWGSSTLAGQPPPTTPDAAGEASAAGDPGDAGGD